jgi:hypothetical protein
MVALGANDIPSSITTVEQLAVWALSVLQERLGQTTIRELGGIGESPMAAVYQSLSPSDGPMLILRAAVKRPANHAQFAEKPWGANRIDEWEKAAGLTVPTGYTS